MNKRVQIIGAGLAGCEAAFWLAEKGISVELYEMRPHRLTEAHQTGQMAELVCSNSFKSLNPITAPGILKKEMEVLGSLSMQAARIAAIDAGEALAVDRQKFSSFIEEKLNSHPNIQIKREEVTSLPDDPNQLVILATGPLTAPSLSNALKKITGSDHFYFYDAISPIVSSDSLNRSIVFSANRYGKITRHLEEENSKLLAFDEKSDEGDYLNCPMNKEQYDSFIALLLTSERVESKSFEKVKHFEGCMPIEEMADRGLQTLRFGPMKPVGLKDPRTGYEPYAVVQLRSENQSRTAFNLVGFQTKLKYGEQSKVFRAIPGLENAEFLRLGSMHRNTFVDAPRVLGFDLCLKSAKHIMLAGQITGVEGYMESASIGILAGIFAHAKIHELPLPYPPNTTAFGALCHHLTNAANTDYQPSGINFGLFEDAPFTEKLSLLKQKYKKIPKEEKRKVIASSSLESILPYKNRVK